MASAAGSHHQVVLSADEQMHLTPLQQQGPQAVPSHVHPQPVYSAAEMGPLPPRPPQTMPVTGQTHSQAQQQGQAGAQSENGTHLQQYPPQ